MIQALNKKIYIILEVQLVRTAETCGWGCLAGQAWAVAICAHTKAVDVLRKEAWRTLALTLVTIEKFSWITADTIAGVQNATIAGGWTGVTYIILCISFYRTGIWVAFKLIKKHV